MKRKELGRDSRTLTPVRFRPTLKTKIKHREVDDRGFLWIFFFSQVNYRLPDSDSTAPSYLDAISIPESGTCLYSGGFPSLSKIIASSASTE